MPDPKEQLSEFSERLRANCSCAMLLELIEGCDRGRFSQKMRATASSNLTNEMTILIVYRQRGVLPS